MLKLKFRFALEEVHPLSKEMDLKKTMDPTLIKKCFDNGFMGIETSQELGGAALNFTSRYSRWFQLVSLSFRSIIIVEELAKQDPAVSVMVDVQNTLVSTCIRKWGTPEQHKKFLPALATKHLGTAQHSTRKHNSACSL